MAPNRLPLPLVACLLAASCASPIAHGCPFCAVESQTLSEEIGEASVAVLARLAIPAAAADVLEDADVPYGLVDPLTGAATFDVETVLKGEPLLFGEEWIEAIYFGDSDPEKRYLIRGVGDPPDWAIPLPLSRLASEYVPQIMALPESGADRLDFFQQFLEHPDALLAQDAYDEFARAPYQDVIDLAPRMDRPQLLAWIGDPGVSPSRRRLFLTMLGVCGREDDRGRLEPMLTSDNRVLSPAADATAAVAMAAGGPPAAGLLAETVRFRERQRKLGLDAMIACYLTLAGKAGEAEASLDLIDERFLLDPDADYSHVYACLQALRFLAAEMPDLVPLERVKRSARLLLDNAEFADQVIPDLARWEDWGVLERLGGMYESTFDPDAEDAPQKYVREPIVTYLDVAAEQEEDADLARRANEWLAKIEPLDPEVVKRARSLRAFGFLAQARAKPAVDASVAVGADGLPDTPGDPGALAAAQGGETRGYGAAGAAPDPTPPAARPAAGETPAGPPPIGQRPAGAAATEKAVPEPGRWALVGLPLLAVVILVGVFWLILRGGSV
ncbi:MAG: hypothetical protein AAF805_06370 [Planctomycetota bacterium]